MLAVAARSPYIRTQMLPARRHLANRVVGKAVSDDKLRGVTNWEGLIQNNTYNTPVDDALAKHLMRYGELCTVTYVNIRGAKEDPGPDFPARGTSFMPDLLMELAKLFQPNPYIQAQDKPQNVLKICLETGISDANEYKAIDNIYACAGPNSLAAKMPKDFAAEGWDDDAVKPAKKIDPKNDPSQRPFWQGLVLVKEAADGTDEELVFVFRGTYRTDEWYSNFKGASQMPYNCTDGAELGDVRVHWGFRNMYSSKLKERWEYAEDKETPRQLVERVITERYVSKQLPLPKITLTGHSLGAALAITAAFHIGHELPSQHSSLLSEKYKEQLRQPGAVVAYAFAAPRVGNLAFADAVHATPGLRVLRVTNMCDPVPRTPFPKESKSNDVLLQALGLSPDSGDSATASSSISPYPQEMPEEMRQQLAQLLEPEQVFAKTMWSASKCCDWVIRKIGGGPVSGEDGAKFADDPNNFMRNYRHVGRAISFKSTEGLCKPRQLRTHVPEFGAAVFMAHNLEVYLIALGAMSKKPFKRDFALLNRSDDLLTDELSKKYGIAPDWLAKQDRGGLLPQGKVYRKEGWTGDDPCDADPVGAEIRS